MFSLLNSDVHVARECGVLNGGIASTDSRYKCGLFLFCLCMRRIRCMRYRLNMPRCECVYKQFEVYHAARDASAKTVCYASQNINKRPRQQNANALNCMAAGIIQLSLSCAVHASIRLRFFRLAFCRNPTLESIQRTLTVL